MRISVVGGGRMGLPLACTFGKNGATVAVCDINGTLVDTINAGRSPFEEPGLGELVAALHADRRISATLDTAGATSRSDAVVVIVPAHLTEDRDIDLSALHSASQEVGRGLRPGTLVVYETTVSVGATRRSLIPQLERFSGLKAGVDFFVAYSPERVKANLVLARLGTTPKVVGGLDAASLERAAALYARYLGAPIDEVGTLEAAEMTKLAGMLYRDVNIALANELAAFCEVAGLDFGKIREAANRDGEAALLIPGIGVGGHCTPVYPYFLTRDSRRRGLTQRISESAREINDVQPAKQLCRMESALGSLEGQRVHILGLGFRPDVKVDTLSPAYALREALRARRATVTIEDPYYSDEEILAAGFSPGTVLQSRIVVLNTAHRAFAAPDFVAWRAGGVEALLDGRNLWNQAQAEAADLHYFGIGRASRYERLNLQVRRVTEPAPIVS